MATPKAAGAQLAAEDFRQMGEFFAALAAAAFPITIADPRQPDTPLVFANQAFAEMTGYAVEDVVGRNCRFLQGPGTDPAARASLRQAMTDGVAVTVEMRNYRRDGSMFWNALSVSPVLGPDGKLRHFVGTQQDVTTRRDTDAALRQTQKLQAVGELTGGVAHDLNNLLTVLVGGLEVLGGAASEVRRQRSLALTREALSRAKRLTGQLLAFASRQQLDPRPEELNGLVRSFDSMARHSLGPGIQLELDVHAEPCAVQVDRGQVHATLVALLANARDAMPDGGRATIRTGPLAVAQAAPPHPQVPAGRYCMVTVQDTGHGMPPDVLLRATEPFFSTRQHQPGRGSAGLGLAGVYGFMRQSCGYLTLDSEPGRGTTARLLFPAQGAPAEIAPAE